MADRRARRVRSGGPEGCPLDPSRPGLMVMRDDPGEEGHGSTSTPVTRVAEPAVIHHRARQMRLAARQTLGRAVQTHAQAMMQSAARVRSSPPAWGRGLGQDQPADSLLAQLLQPRLAPAPADASRAVTEPELAAVCPSSTPGIRAELTGLEGRWPPSAARSRPSTAGSSSPAQARPSPGLATCAWCLRRSRHPPAGHRTPSPGPLGVSSQATWCETV